MTYMRLVLGLVVEVVDWQGEVMCGIQEHRISIVSLET